MFAKMQAKELKTSHIHSAFSRRHIVLIMILGHWLEMKA
jgi:hypothetical protein